MKLQFEYEKNTYEIDVEEKHLCSIDEDRIIKLIVKVNNDIVNLQYKLDKDDIPTKCVLVGKLLVHNATLVDKDELAFKQLLQQYNLQDNDKTCKLWYKCYELGHAYGLDEMVGHWHDLVELIVE